MGGAHITTAELGIAFGAKQVLSGVNLNIKPGDFLSIVGKSGCGKSTLLRLLMGLEAPTQGALQSDAAGAARIMFQEPRLLPWANVADNVAIGLGPKKSAKDARAAALAVLKEVGLGDRGGEWPSVLSGGQRQRVALARALVSRPRLLALDEPLGALDALTRIEMQQLLENVWREQGFTALLVTHDVGEAVALGDRVIVLEGGGVALDVTVDLPRPRRRGDAAYAAIEGQILDRLLEK